MESSDSGRFPLFPSITGYFGLNLQARSFLLIVVLAATFMGAASSIQELVKERQIFLRERSTGLSSTAYVASKIVVLGTLVIAQSVFFTLFTFAGRPMPERGLVYESSTFEIVLVVSLLALIGMLLGLLVSNFARTSEIALPALVVITMLQIVFSGAVPLRYESLAQSLGLVNPALLGHELHGRHCGPQCLTWLQLE